MKRLNLATHSLSDNANQILAEPAMRKGAQQNYAWHNYTSSKLSYEKKKEPLCL